MKQTEEQAKLGSDIRTLYLRRRKLQLEAEVRALALEAGSSGCVRSQDKAKSGSEFWCFGRDMPEVPPDGTIVVVAGRDESPDKLRSRLRRALAKQGDAGWVYLDVSGNATAAQTYRSRAKAAEDAAISARLGCVLGD